MMKFEGIMPPLLTPFTSDEKLDEEALRNEIQYMLDAGVHGLTICGSTGEGYSMPPEEIERITTITKEESNSKVPIITGIIADSANIALNLGMAAKKAGADALMVTPVHYVFLPTEEGTIQYFKQIGETLNLPIIIYNVIQWNTVSAPLAQKLAKIKQIQGIKQSGGDIHGLADMIRAVGHKMPIMTAIDDMIFPSFIIGANGAIAAINTVTPELCIQAWEAARDNDTKTGVEIHHRLLPLWRTIGKGDMPSRAKEALKQLGRPVGPARSPLINVNDLVKKEIHNALKEAKLIK